MTIELDNWERQILLECPIRINTQKGRKPTRIEAARMVRIKRLWSNGYVRGSVENDGDMLLVQIRDAGRLAIGRPAIEEGATHAPGA